MPTLLAAVRRFVGNGHELAEVLTGRAPAEPVAASVSEMLEDEPGTEAAVARGRERAARLFGQKLAWAEDFVAFQSGLRASSVQPLLGLGMHVIGTSIEDIGESEGLSLWELTSLLVEHNCVERVPPALANMLDLRWAPPDAAAHARALDLGGAPRGLVWDRPRAVREERARRNGWLTGVIAASAALGLATVTVATWMMLHRSGLELGGRAIASGQGTNTAVPTVASLASSAARQARETYVLEIGPFRSAGQAEATARTLGTHGYDTTRRQERAGDHLYFAVIDEIAEEALAAEIGRELEQEGLPHRVDQAGGGFRVRLAEPVPLGVAAPLASRYMERGLTARFERIPGVAVAHLLRHGSFRTRQEAEAARAELARLGVAADVIAAR